MGGSVKISALDVRKRARELAAAERVMTIASVCQNRAWSAPVYYHFSAPFFYFFSNRDARHVKETLNKGNGAAASLFSDDKRIKNIRGLQMEGRVEAVANDAEGYLKAAAYVKKFQMNTAGAESLTYLKKTYRAEFFRFVPTDLHYLDNSIQFGFRTKISL